MIPSNPYDAKGLLISAIEDDDPVLFFEPKRLYNGPFDGHYEKPVETWARHPAGEVPAGYYTIPLGKAAVARAGEALTILAYGTMVHVAHSAAAETGVDAEILDLRTLMPIDIAAITGSVEKTGRCLIVHEATRTSGYGSELSALVRSASITWKRRSCASPAGIRHTRKSSSGNTSPGRTGWLMPSARS